MSMRIFFAGAAVGAVVGALAVVALRSEPTATSTAVNAITATERKERISTVSEPPTYASTNAVPSAANSAVSTTAAPLDGTEAIIFGRSEIGAWSLL